jgi:hypothetical protein
MNETALKARLKAIGEEKGIQVFSDRPVAHGMVLFRLLIRELKLTVPEL